MRPGPAGDLSLHLESAFGLEPRYLVPALAMVSWHFREAGAATVIAAGVRSSHVAAGPAAWGTASSPRTITPRLLDMWTPLVWMNAISSPGPLDGADGHPSLSRDDDARKREATRPRGDQSMKRGNPDSAGDAVDGPRNRDDLDHLEERPGPPADVTR